MLPNWHLKNEEEAEIKINAMCDIPFENSPIFDAEKDYQRNNQTQKFIKDAITAKKL